MGRAAASDAARWSLDHARDEEADQIAEACSKGVKVANADARQIASLKEAAEPFYQTLRDDPRLRRSCGWSSGSLLSSPRTALPRSLLDASPSRRRVPGCHAPSNS